MPVEITGLVSHNSGTPLYPAAQGEFDPQAIVESARAQEAAGYDRVLIANNSLMPDSHNIATFVLSHTTRLKVLLAHRPGFIAPTMAARMLTTVDRLSGGGRVTVHIIAGPSDKELEADGDFTAKPERYARALEYVQVMRKAWGADAPFDHEGPYYRCNNAYAPVRPEGGAIPVSWAGTSPESVEACGQVADLFAMSGDSLANIGATMERVRAAADAQGRKVGFMMTILAILGDTEEQAWAKAERVLSLYRARPRGGVVVCFDEMGPIQLIPHQGSGWAPLGRPERLRATYSKPHGVRYLFGTYDVHADHLEGTLESHKNAAVVLGCNLLGDGLRDRLDPRRTRS